MRRQELLSTFDDGSITEVALAPSYEKSARRCLLFSLSFRARVAFFKDSER